jgi:hypothetical protein
MAYGTQAQVAALAKVWTKNGQWTAFDLYGNCTNPTLEQVEAWLDEVSSLVDLALANNGFETPVLVPAATKAIGSYVSTLVSDLCHAANSSGRFFTERFIERGSTPMSAIQADIEKWVGSKVTGLTLMGVPKIPNTTGKNTAIIEVI